MGPLQKELDCATQVRDGKAFRGFITGFLLSAFFTWDLFISVIIGVGLGLVVSWTTSGEVNRLKEIQNMRRK